MIQFLDFLAQVCVDGRPLQMPNKTEISWEMPTFISFNCGQCNHCQQSNLYGDSQGVVLGTPDIPDKESAISIAQAFQLNEIHGGAELIYFKLSYKESSVATISLFECINCESQYILCWAESGDYSRSSHILYIQGLARVSPLHSTTRAYFQKGE